MTDYPLLPFHQRTGLGGPVTCVVCSMRAIRGKRTLRGFVCVDCLKKEALDRRIAKEK